MVRPNQTSRTKQGQLIFRHLLAASLDFMVNVVTLVLPEGVSRSGRIINNRLVVTITAQKRLVIFVPAALALMASGYLFIFLNPKFSLFGVATIFLALFLILGLVAHASHMAEGQVLEKTVLEATTR